MRGPKNQVMGGWFSMCEYFGPVSKDVGSGEMWDYQGLMACWGVAMVLQRIFLLQVPFLLFASGFADLSVGRHLQEEG